MLKISDIRVPLPGPRSTIFALKKFDLIWLSIILAAINSPNTCETSGAVIKSPFLPFITEILLLD